MNKIIHISIDEKFINSAYNQFNELNYVNEFHIVTRIKDEQFKHIENKPNIFRLYPSKEKIKDFASKTVNSIVIFHGLGFYASIFAKYLKPNQKNKLVWFLWGSEFYFNKKIFPQGETSYLGEKSLFLQKKDLRRSLMDRAKDFLQEKAMSLYYFTPSKSTLIKNTMLKMDAIGILYPEEHALISKTLNYNPKFLKYSYYPIEAMINDLNMEVNGNDILLGNSSSFTNNHLEAFDLLKSLPLGDKKVICPLSYGDKKYSETISSSGKEILGDQFVPLLSYMTLAEYNKIIQSCGIVIMNHYRQQGVGNVVVMAYFGAKIYLDERSTIYDFLKNLGIYVFSIQKDLTNENRLVLENLNQNEREHNRTILLKYMSKEELKVCLVNGLNDLYK